MNKLPDDFCYEDYIILNHDLDPYASNKKLKRHYLKHGIYENRKYKCSKIQDISKINILVVIISCQKNKHIWDNIKKRTNHQLIIVCGDNKNENFYDKNNQVLNLMCNDLYDGLPEKIILMIDEILRNKNFKDITHIIKIDDHDNYFKNEDIQKLHKCKKLILFDYLGQKLNCWNKDVVGNYHFGKVPVNSYWHNRIANISNVPYFDGGCSYILSRKAMTIINRTYNRTNIQKLRVNEIYEDLMVGKILNDHNIKPCEVNFGIIGDK